MPPRATQLHARYQAQTAEVLCAGRIIAMHFHEGCTGGKNIVVMMDRMRWQKMVRTFTDANGRPIPDLKETDPERVEYPAEYHADQQPRSKRPPSQAGIRGWEIWSQQPHRTLSSVAKEVGATPSALSQYFRRYHLAEYDRLKPEGFGRPHRFRGQGERQPIFKPNGRLL